MQEEEAIESVTGIKRNQAGQFVKGAANVNPSGRPKDTPEKKIQRKAVKAIIDEYRESLADVLPELSPILKEMARSKDIGAIKEVHDRVLGKAHQTTDITSGGEKITNESQALANAALAKFLNGTTGDTGK